MGASRRKKRAQATAHSAVRRDLRTEKYRMRVVTDKTKYNRKKNRKIRVQDCPKAA